MRFIIKTLVDITETRARKGEDKVLYGQQQNYMTFLNTLGLRCNINPIGSPKADFTTTNDFGSSYKGEHKVWTQIIEIDYEDATNTDFMRDDFDIVPVITGLSETVELNLAVFKTNDKKLTHIVFNSVTD
jgi:hypothetical protein